MDSFWTLESEKFIKLDGLVDNVRKMLAEEKRKSRQASLRSTSSDEQSVDMVRKETILWKSQ